MQPARSDVAGIGLPTSATRRWDAPIEATINVLELVGSEQPQLLKFQVHVLCNSTMSFAMQKIATELGVPVSHLDTVIGRACRDLDRLEKQPGRWRELSRALASPNLAALRYVCRARLSRIWNESRRRRLKRIARQVEESFKLARTRVWIDEFIGPLPSKKDGGSPR